MDTKDLETVSRETIIADDDFLTREDLSIWLKMSVANVDKIFKVSIPIYRIGKGSRSYRYKRSEVIAWLESNKEMPKSKREE